ncbi:hypothetical protein RGQ29_032021 [Quercus rubra]|uniref:Uncharacterized protein n=1 Tax=Quercus rubra TaxID=3512 RepID=A0AAN7I5C4_QUERU|nr:hypothetical protein RGQ29_032021 [Quercus rubra]
MLKKLETSAGKSMEFGWLLPGPHHLQSKIKPLSSNMDPLQQHLDKEIWKDLNKYNLTMIVNQDQRLLGSPGVEIIAEDRENWSIGQLTAVPVLLHFMLQN